MGEYYTYQKKRREYGKWCNFSDSEIKLWGYFPTKQVTWSYINRDPNFIDLDNIPEYSEHYVNTERVNTSEKGMSHKEGGWPQGIDPSEPVETNRLRRKYEKDPNFTMAVKELSSTVKSCIEQNNQIDLFEEYFLDEESEHFVENISTKTLMLLKDQNQNQRRSISELSWHPDGPQKLAVSYASTRFQQLSDKIPLQSYVWDVNNPNVPDVVLNTPSALTNIAYNQKITDQIGGGCYNGLVTIWDVKKGSQPVFVSPVEKSHQDPITHFLWLSSKTGTELVTSSTDGKVLWWDTRKFSDGPVESLLITEQFQVGDNKIDRTIGGTVIEYNVESGPNKFLIGTEQGSILMANKKPKKAVEITTRFGLEEGRHLGPVYAINRSIPNPRYFLSVGDWCAKIWFEDLKSPIIRTKDHASYLSDGCFSPTRLGVFFLTRKDGWLDVWDYFYRQNELAFSHKVSDSALTCIKLNLMGGGLTQAGKLCACGDQDGTVTVMELCESLYAVQPKEKEVIAEMFERETRKEKTLEQLKKIAEKKQAPREKPEPKNVEDKKQAMIEKLEEEFYQMIGEDPEYEEQQEQSVGDYGQSPKRVKKDQEDKEDKEDKEEKQEKQEQSEKDEKQQEQKQDQKQVQQDQQAQQEQQKQEEQEEQQLKEKQQSQEQKEQQQEEKEVQDQQQDQKKQQQETEEKQEQQMKPQEQEQEVQQDQQQEKQQEQQENQEQQQPQDKKEENQNKQEE